jgi:hypothetical protein
MMSEFVVKATLPAAAELLLRWFKSELNDKMIRVDTMNFLRLCGKLPPDLSLPSQSAKDSAGFCGYDWMIDAIRQWGRILADPPSESMTEVRNGK